MRRFCLFDAMKSKFTDHKLSIQARFEFLNMALEKSGG